MLTCPAAHIFVALVDQHLTTSTYWESLSIRLTEEQHDNSVAFLMLKQDGTHYLSGRVSILSFAFVK